MPVQRRVTADGLVSFLVPPSPGRPQRTYRVPRGADEGEAFRAAEEYYREGKRALDLLDAEIKTLGLRDLRLLVLARRALPKGKSLEAFVEDLYGTAARPIGLVVAVRTYLQDLLSRGRSPIHISTVRRTLGDLLATVGDETLLSLHRPVLQDYLDGARTDKVYNKRRAILSAFFAWARGKLYVVTSPVDDIPVRSVRSTGGEITFLTLDQIRALFRITLHREPGLLWYYAMQVFAGLRPTEAQGVEIPTGTMEYVRVGAERAKTRSSRLSPVLPPLHRILTGFPCPQPTVPYDTARERRLRSILRKEGVPMSPDILRHTFASYRFPVIGDGELSQDMGNSPAIVFRHYRGVVSRADADAFLQLDPLQDFTAEAEKAYRIRGVLRKFRSRKKRAREEKEPLLVRPFFPRKRDSSLPSPGADLHHAEIPPGDGGVEQTVEIPAMPGEGAATRRAVPPPVIPHVLENQRPTEVI